MDFFAKHWGDLAGLLGLAFTIWAVLRTKAAAEQARDAAQQVKDRMSSLVTVEAVSAAITALEEIKGLHRIRAWDLALSRYPALRRHLVTMEAGLNEEQQVQIAKAISQFRIMESEVERATASQELDQIDLVRFNRIISAQIDTLAKVMIAIKQAGV